MGEVEARQVFESLDVDIHDQLTGVLQRTEGWPVAIYLTAQAMKGGSAGLDDIRGDDILFADYLEQELLGNSSDDIRAFLMRTSILDQLSAPLCDSLLLTEGSADTLARLESQSLLVVPMDRTRTWYRYHSLLRELLSSELERHHDGEASALHARAADWFMDNDRPDLAIEHAIAAGDTARFADMAIASARRIYSEGRVETISRWWEWMQENGAVGELPEVAAVASFFRALDGDAAGSELMAAHALGDRNGRARPDDQLGPLALMLRSCQAAKGVNQVVADAQAARVALGADSDWFHICLGQEATGVRATDGALAADVIWAEALLRSQAIGAHPASSYAAAHRSLAAIDRDDWETAESFIDLALEFIGQGALQDYITSALGFSVAARVEARKGNLDTAQGYLTNAASIRPRLSVGIPLGSVLTLHEMARAFIELADVAGARRVMREAADILAMRPKLGTLVTEHNDLKETLSALPAGTVGASSLTKAELRVLPLLVTHLSYPEIADRLFVSRHTVKAHAMSIYRKLGVSSRSDAVAKSREIGLIST
jgi:LuxR family maltose regulon positive regulatory protein